jgi:hypothetical protein
MSSSDVIDIGFLYFQFCFFIPEEEIKKNVTVHHKRINQFSKEGRIVQLYLKTPGYCGIICGISKYAGYIRLVNIRILNQLFWEIARR